MHVMSMAISAQCENLYFPGCGFYSCGNFSFSHGSLGCELLLELSDIVMRSFAAAADHKRAEMAPCIGLINYLRDLNLPRALVARQHILR